MTMVPRAIEGLQRLRAMTRHKARPDSLAQGRCRHRAKSVGSAEKVRKRAHELFCLGRLNRGSGSGSSVVRGFGHRHTGAGPVKVS
jgi:hypothetical protein